jgi:hypothetical protein
MSGEYEKERYHELSYYTLAHSAPSFIHQHIVDAFTAQRADESTRPIGLVFALIGLYLHLEKGYSGKQVQRAHMKLAKHRKQWPKLALPSHRGALRVSDVLAVPPGPERDWTIDQWCASVWEAYRENRDGIIELIRESRLFGI